MRNAAIVLLFVLTVVPACRPADTASVRPADIVHAMQEPDWFQDRAGVTGLGFQHVNGMSGRFDLFEMMGPGVAAFDYDNDGDLDLLIVQGRGSPALYRNDLTIAADGSRRQTFVDVTPQSALTSSAYGMGVATGDFDNNGCADVYLTNFGANRLFRNNCDGTFTDVTAPSGTASPGWSVSATFFDYDRDGWLDLFVGHYVSYDAAHATPCFSVSGRRDYCSPNAYRPEQSRLYHNNHDGTFTDVTTNAGLAGDFGPTLGVVADDLDGDGWLDLYVANDGRENQLWINQRNGTFRNGALLAGVAITAEARTTGSMGVDAADLDGDGADDLVVTTLAGEGASVFANRGRGLFEDVGARTRVRPLSAPFTGFGMRGVDVDNDGWIDLVAANGAVRTIDAQAQAGEPLPLRHQLLRNTGDGRFEDATARAGAAFARLGVNRGAAFGDLDNDGDTDIVITSNNGPVQVLVNEIGNRHHWVGLRLVDTHGRDAPGARVDVGGRTRRVATDGSYGSASDPRVLVGLGDSTTPPAVRVTWPDGRQESWPSVPIDRYTTLEEGGRQ